LSESLVRRRREEGKRFPLHALRRRLKRQNPQVLPLRGVIIVNQEPAIRRNVVRCFTVGDFTSKGSGASIPPARLQYKSPIAPLSVEEKTTWPSGDTAGEPSVPSLAVNRLKIPR